MALEQRLSLKLSQRLVMTPALQQAIKLLQMSTIELRAEIATELQENPALEEGPASPENTASTDVETPAETGETTDSPDAMSEVDLEYMLQNYYESGPALPRGTVEQREETASWETNLSRPENLATHLTRQLALATSDETLIEIGDLIIGNLDADGYLRAETEELVAMGDHAPEDVERALVLVQGLDPPGVAARDLRECLLNQLSQRGMLDTPAAVIVRDHLDLLPARRYEEIAQRLEIDLADLKAELEILRTLQPKPGERFSTSQAVAVIPDVFVIKMDGGYQVVLNDDGFPRLRVSKYCRSIIRAGSAATREDKEFVRGKLNAAVRLIKSIEERQRTIYKVACSIVTQQRSFLDRGLDHIRPMVLRDVAEDIGVHESTVSRVVNNKYMHTPNGVFEMRFFFHSGLTNNFGEDISSLTIKEKIRHLVEQEDAGRPLSDSAIARHLKENERLPIARRTVAKYREELKIPASTLRKRALFPD
ncbi:MAG: RNA polymerase factor sigma-54 [Acidobacteriota bacterium]